MGDENKSRRCSFELFPDERTGDKIADELIANEKLKERGRFMRAMLVTGAAFAAIDWPPESPDNQYHLNK
ncbi:plasmid partitioning/stability family protein [Escherichia albertii]|uniref:plasmid partitioning/stability family protein n=1 Tax=Escherichia albertii TaxID=208962 RepID=UPI0039BF0C14